jgi:hypothetical protein
MRDLENPTVIFNNDRQWWENIAGTKHTIDIFHENGLKVMLKPSCGLGHGFIQAPLVSKRIMENTGNQL